MFGVTGYCSACQKQIPAFEMVMRARDNVYHLECFKCEACSHRFCVGDRFYLQECKILCEYDYEEQMSLFAQQQQQRNYYLQTGSSLETLPDSLLSPTSQSQLSPQSFLSPPPPPHSTPTSQHPQPQQQQQQQQSQHQTSPTLQQQQSQQQTSPTLQQQQSQHQTSPTLQQQQSQHQTSPTVQQQQSQHQTSPTVQQYSMLNGAKRPLLDSVETVKPPKIRHYNNAPSFVPPQLAMAGPYP